MPSFRKRIDCSAMSASEGGSLVAGLRDCRVVPALAFILLVSLTPLPAASQDRGCPADAIDVPPGASLNQLVADAAPDRSFCIRAGVHRGQYIRPKNGQRFFGEAGSILNGSTVLTEFRRSGPNWIASHRSTGVARGECAKDSTACAFPIGLFIDGKPLQQAKSRSAIAKGGFFYDRRAGELEFADDPNGKLVEVTKLPHAFLGPSENVLIKGLVIEKYFSPAQEGAVQAAFGRGWRIENTEFRYNSGAGVTIGTGASLLNSKIHHNGQLGVGATGTNISIEGNEIWANNLYGFDFTWEAGGVKVAKGKRVMFRGNHVHDNSGPGLWCDIDCEDVTFEDNTVQQNDGAGIFFEISHTAVIRNNRLEKNGMDHRGWFWGADILIAAAEKVQVYDNRIVVRPGGNAIMLIDQNRERLPTGMYKTRYNNVRNNHISFLGAGGMGGVSDAGPGAENFAIIENGENVFDANQYFVQPPNKLTFVWGTKLMDFAAFRSRGQEQRGRLVENGPR